MKTESSSECRGAHITDNSVHSDHLSRSHIVIKTIGCTYQRYEI